MSSVRVLFFGPARDAAGADQVTLDLALEATLAQVIEGVFEQFPRLIVGRASLRFAVNGAFANPDLRMKSGDEIAVIPPVSGGQDDGVLVELADAPIDAERVRRFVSGDATLGGVVTFEGSTRAERHPRHGALLRLDYAAYHSMALDQMRKLATSAVERWPIGRLAVVHRIGMVEPGAASVIIAVACPHRAEAFEACRWLIDTLKREVPIWKQECWADGQRNWVDPTGKEGGDGPT